MSMYLSDQNKIWLEFVFLLCHSVFKDMINKFLKVQTGFSNPKQFSKIHSRLFFLPDFYVKPKASNVIGFIFNTYYIPVPHAGYI